MFSSSLRLSLRLAHSFGGGNFSLCCAWKDVLSPAPCCAMLSSLTEFCSSILFTLPGLVFWGRLPSFRCVFSLPSVIGYKVSAAPSRVFPYLSFVSLAPKLVRVLSKEFTDKFGGVVRGALLSTSCGGSSLGLVLNAPMFNIYVVRFGLYFRVVPLGTGHLGTRSFRSNQDEGGNGVRG